MGFLGLGEPSLGTFIILLGAWINRDFTTPVARSGLYDYHDDAEHGLDLCDGPNVKREQPSSTIRQDKWRPRELSAFGYQVTILTPNTTPFETRILSRLLLRFPFILEIIYWALIYSVYQMGRGFLAQRLTDSTIDVACRHALQVIRVEQSLHIFWELDIQRRFLKYPQVMYWINRIYSFVHLPATVTFLVGLYWFAITRNRGHPGRESRSSPYLYESKRRGLAICNLLAFAVFSTWPCMPPRLLGDSESPGEVGELARSFGFVDTVHGRDGAVSVFNTRAFTNQLAAMPSLHFGYSLLIGISIMQLPITYPGRCYRLPLPSPFAKRSGDSWTIPVKIPSFPKLACLFIGFLYPFTILVAIVTTANHFIMDAIAGGTICMVALRYNEWMLNLLPLEDCILWCLRIHKPVQQPVYLPAEHGRS